MSKKILLATVVLWLLGTIFGIATCGGVFNWVYALPPNIWKDPASMMSSNSMIIANLLGIVRAYIFVRIFVWLYKGLPGKGTRKGLNYGLIVWLVGTFSGMASMPLYMTINSTVIIYWIAQALVLNFLNGWVVGKMFQ